LISGPIPYEEKQWLEYGTDYEVSRIEEKDTGGTLYLLASPPSGVQQLVIRRNTPKTQEVDLHNGARMAAELIEGVGDKATMEIQELAEQVVQKDDLNELRKVMNDAIVAEETARKEADQKLQEAIETEAAERKEADAKLQVAVDEEAAARKAADDKLQEAVEAEAAERKEADLSLQKAIDAEEEARKAADNKLLEAIEIETAERKEADRSLEEAVAAEEKARKEADQLLLEAIDAEADARKETDAKLLEAIVEEAEYREDADKELMAAIETETDARLAAEEKLQEAIDTGIGEHIHIYLEEHGDTIFQGFGTIPSGGTAGQILEKASDDDFDTRWADKPAGGGTGNGGTGNGTAGDGGGESGSGEINEDEFVRVAGDQTVGGVKTFTSIPVLPSCDPADGDEAARKAYVDALFEIYAAGGGATGGGTGTGGSGRKCATIVIGNTGAKHTANDVDYLCTGTNDHIIINNAITALPSGGGMIILREGTYKLGGTITVNKDKVVLQGMGDSTELKLTEVTGKSYTIIDVSKSNCKIAGIKLSSSVNPENGGYGIYITGDGNTVTGNNIMNGSTSGSTYGVYILGKNNSVTGNNIANSSSTASSTGVHITVNNATNNLVEGNTIANKGTGGSTGVRIEQGSSGNRVMNNTINNSGGGSTGVLIQGINGDSNGIGGLVSEKNVVSGNTIMNSATDSSGSSTGIQITANANNNAVLGNNIANTAKNISYGVDINTSNNIVTGNRIANTKVSGTNNNCIGIYITKDNNVVSGNIITNSNATSTDCIGISITENNNTITSNNIMNSCSGTSYGVKIFSSNNNTVTGNNIMNSSSGNYSYGIYIDANSASTSARLGHVVTGNNISNYRTAGQSTSNTYAIYISSAIRYTCIISNNLRGVTGADSPGSACYYSNSALPGSATTVEALGIGGSCGLNIV
jgi:hypothetical protein